MNTTYLKNITAYGHLLGVSKLAVSIWQQLEIIFEQNQFGFQKHFEPRRDQRINLKSLSWQEILGIDEKGEPVTRYHYKKAFAEIGTSYGSMLEYHEADLIGDIFQGKPYCRVYDRHDRGRTWYYRNDEFIEVIIKPAILNFNKGGDLGLKP